MNNYQDENSFSEKQCLLKKFISFQSLLSQFNNSQVRNDLSTGIILTNNLSINLLEDLDKLRNILQPRYEGLVYVRDAKCEVAAAHCVALMDQQDAPFSLSDACSSCRFGQILRFVAKYWHFRP